MTRPDRPLVYMTRTSGYENLRPGVRRGTIKRVRHGAYLKPRATTTWEQRDERALAHCHAVARSLTCPFAFTQESAALIRGWPVTVRDLGTHIVQATRPSRQRSDDIHRHHAPDLAELEIEWIDGLPVIGADQTVLSCARALAPRDALATVDGAFTELAGIDRFDQPPSRERQEVLRARLLSHLAAIGPGRNVVRAREVLTYADGFAELPGESRSRWLVLSRGFPVPRLQLPVMDRGQLYFIDMTWLTADGDAGEPIGLEYDGGGKYRGPGREAAIRGEKVRELDVKDHVPSLTRWTRDHLAQPDRAVAQLAAKFPADVRASFIPRPLLLDRH